MSLKFIHSEQHEPVKPPQEATQGEQSDTFILLMRDKVDALDMLKERLVASDRVFAKSLISDFELKGVLSDKQMYWVGALIAKVLGESSDGGFIKLFDLFKKAKSTYNYPKLHLKIDASPVYVNLCGAKSKYPGSLSLLGAGEYPDQIWFGAIDIKGVLIPSSKFKDTPMLTSIGKFLMKLARHPKDAVLDHYTESTTCCFCGCKIISSVEKKVGCHTACAKEWGVA